MKYISLVALTCVLLLFGGLLIGQGGQPRFWVAENGRMDLTGWAPDEDGPVPLNGRWEFYWNRHLSPDEFRGATPPAPDAMVEVPGVWNDTLVGGRELGAHGMGTYRLVIDLPPAEARKLAMRLEDAGTSMTVFANGVMVHKSGITGPREKAVPGSNPTVAHMGPSQGKLELVVWVSNWHHRLGGLWRGMMLGLPAQAKSLLHLGILWAGILSGALLIIGAYHLISFLLNKQDASFFYFGMFCVFVGLRVLVTDCKVLQLVFSQIEWAWMKRVEYISIFIAMPCVFMYLRNLYPLEISGRVGSLAMWINCLLIAVVLFFPAAVFSYTTLVFYPVTVAGIIYLAQRLWVAQRRRRQNAAGMLLCFLALAGVAMHDILVAQTTIDFYYLLPLGLMVFTFAQAGLLAYRTKRAMQTLHMQQEALAEKNLAIERENSQRRAAENALRKSESRFRQLSELLPEPVIETDDLGRITFYNVSASQIVPPNRDNSDEACNVADLVTPDFRPLVESTMREVLSGTKINGREFDVQSGDGKVVPMALYANAIVNNGNAEGVRAIVLDITERKKMEKRLRQAQSLEMVGTLAGGVAHDFNNILQASSGYLQLMASHTTHDAKMSHYIEMILEENRRAAELTRRLLTFSRKLEPEIKVVDLNQEVDRLARLLRRTVPRMIRIETAVDADLWPIMADSTQMGQMLLNLGGNAADAMPAGGLLRISTENVTLGEEFCREKPDLRPGPYCLLTVADTGMGMDAESKKRMFEPFYTTKEVGKGTGLGLSMVYGIVQSHHGHILVDTTQGAGTSIKVFLPALPGAAAEPAPRPAAAPAKGHGRTILVVDDEAALVEIMSDFLQACDYRVLAASQGEQAVEIFEKHHPGIDLIIMDLNMPGMGGAAAVRAIRALNPDVPIIMVSGNLDDPANNDLLAAPGMAGLAKPHGLDELARLVSSMIGSR